MQIKRSNRKTLAIEIQEDGSILVRAPKHVREQTIHAFLQEKTSWIARHSARARAQYAKRPQRTFTQGEPFLYLGNTLPLRFVNKQNRTVACEDAFYVRQSAAHRAKEVLERWYKTRARQIFTQRCEQYAADMHTSFHSIRLSSAKTRWGSCGAKNTLNLNWRLVMAPMPVIDSVVVHELAHTQHKNHSKHFWALVKRHCKNYDEHNAWLKENRPLLIWS